MATDSAVLSPVITDEIRVKVCDQLTAERLALAGRLVGVMQQGDRVASIGVALLAIAGNAAVAANQAWVLMLLPTLFSALVCFVAYLNAEMFALGGYISVIEDVLCDLSGWRLLAWESRVATQRHRSGVILVFRLVVATLWALVAFGALLVSWNPSQVSPGGASAMWGWRLFTTTSVVLGLICMVIAALSANRQRRMAITAAKEVYAPMLTATLRARHPG